LYVPECVLSPHPIKLVYRVISPSFSNMEHNERRKNAVSKNMDKYNRLEGFFLIYLIIEAKL
jgi:hypothetical protein